MKPLAVVAAVAGGLVAALVWVLFTITWGRFDLLLWGIGALAGLAAWFAGGRGVTMGAVCAAVTIASIAAGHFAIAAYIVNKRLPQHWADQATAYDRELTVEAYENLMRAAEATPELTAPADYAAFLVRFELSPALDPAAVTDEELRLFEAVTLPVLRRMRAERPSYEHWRSRRLALFETQLQQARREVTIARVAQDGLRPGDLGALWNYVFIALAIGTAYYLGRGPKNENAAARGEEARGPGE